jgi:hypothetical protein
MASQDFTGRTVDLFIFQGVEETGNQAITTGWGIAGELCTGVQKIAQSWAMLFLTRRGSVYQDPLRGSDFLLAARSGRIQVDEDIPAEFGIASAQVQRTMDLDSADADPTPEDDEILVRAELLDYDLDQNSSLLRLKVRLHSLAGDARTIFLPIPVPVR